MPLWIFETDTLKAMLTDAWHVFHKNTGETATQAGYAIREITAELQSRNAI